MVRKTFSGGTCPAEQAPPLTVVALNEPLNLAAQGRVDKRAGARQIALILDAQVLYVGGALRVAAETVGDLLPGRGRVMERDLRLSTVTEHVLHGLVECGQILVDAWNARHEETFVAAQ